eukprot:12352299-Karenia_brevis.AAC.1
MSPIPRSHDFLSNKIPKAETLGCASKASITNIHMLSWWKIVAQHAQKNDLSILHPTDVIQTCMQQLQLRRR